MGYTYILGTNTHNRVCSLWQPVAILSDLADFFKQQDKWPHEGTNSPWEEEQGQESGLISGIKDTALLYNSKFLTEFIKRFFSIVIFKDYFNWGLLCQLNTPSRPTVTL